MPLHRIAALVAVCCATAASAQATVPGQTQPGFFRPTDNADLTAPRPNEVTRPTEDLVAEDHVQATQHGAAADRAPDPAQVMQWTQEQMDRSQREAQAAKPAPGTPAPINGAFTGSTNERDR